MVNWFAWSRSQAGACPSTSFRSRKRTKEGRRGRLPSQQSTLHSDSREFWIDVTRLGDVPCTALRSSGDARLNSYSTNIKPRIWAMWSKFRSIVADQLTSAGTRFGVTSNPKKLGKLQIEACSRAAKSYVAPLDHVFGFTMHRSNGRRIGWMEGYMSMRTLRKPTKSTQPTTRMGLKTNKILFYCFKQLMHNNFTTKLCSNLHLHTDVAFIFRHQTVFNLSVLFS